MKKNFFCKYLFTLSGILATAACGNTEQNAAKPHHELAATASMDMAGGGWTGGGGLIAKDSNNPWWVKNTRDVNVCVEIDEENFGISAARAMEIAQGSIAWWTSNLAGEKDLTGIGTQTFHVTSECNAQTDLRIQFGVLSSQQQAQWKQSVAEPPQQYAGIAIRTEYDKIQMRGKGFIYLSPQKGSLQLDLAAYQTPNPWSFGNGRLAAIILMHELGHVFGYQHGSALLMSPNFIDDIFEPSSADNIAKRNADPFAGDPNFSNPFELKRLSVGAYLAADESPDARAFYGLPKGELFLVWQWTERNFSLFILPSRDAWDKRMLHASADLSVGFRSWIDDTLSISSVYLPPGNQVFMSPQFPPNNHHLRLPIATQPDYCSQTGVLKTSDGKVERKIQLIRKDRTFSNLEAKSEFVGKPVSNAVIFLNSWN